MNISDFHQKNLKITKKANLNISDFQKNLKNQKNLANFRFSEKSENLEISDFQKNLKNAGKF